MNNVAGIDISKGKSTVSVLRPFGEVVAKPFSITIYLRFKARQPAVSFPYHCLSC